MTDSESMNESVASLFWQTVDSQPDQPALRTRDGYLTYRELDNTVCRIANQLNVECGPASEQSSGLVAILIDHRPELILAILGIRLSSRGYAPLDASFPEARLQAVTNNIQPEAIVTTDKYAELARQVAPAGCVVVSFEQLLAGSNQDRPVASANPDSPAYLLSTSGTTGEPKSILHDEKSLIRSARHYCADLDVTGRDNIGLVVPCTYTPSVFCIFGAMLSGATLCLYDLKTQQITELVDWIEQEQISLMYCSPTIFRRLIGECEVPDRLASIRSIQLAGEPLFRSDVDAYRDRFGHLFSLYNGMGTSETSCLTRFFIHADTELESERVPIGLPYDDVELKILDANGEPVADGEDGELIAQSVFIADGYWQRPDLSQEAFSEADDGRGTIIYRTGDRARRLPDGNIVHLGRSDDQLKLRGQRIEVAEIEATILRSGMATAASTVLIEPENADPFLAAFYTPPGEVGELRKYLSTQLPTFMIPTRIVSLDALPQTTSGKVDRRALQNYDFNPGTPSEDSNAEAESIIEKRILECFRAVLKNDSLHVDSDFFLEGGDSLRAVELAIEMENVLATPINVSSLIEAPTPRKMALEAKRSLSIGSARNIVRFRRDQDHDDGTEAALPVFCLPGLFGDALSFRALAAELIKKRPVYAIEYAGSDGSTINFETVDDIVEICFDAINAVYPTGPVALVCYSSGGAIGFALTHRLQEAGREIALVAMMDCYAPFSLRLRHIRDSVVRFVKKLRPQPKVGVMDERYQVVNQAVTSAIFHYRPKPLAIDNMLLIVAKEQAQRSRLLDDYKEWHKLISTPFETVSVDGDHLSLIMPEKAGEISSLIEEFMPAEESNASGAEEGEHAVMQMFTDIWAFKGAPDLNLEIVDAQAMQEPARTLLANPKQLTQRVEAHIGERVRTQLLTSKQIGRNYYRKVALTTQETDRVAWVAAIRIAMDRFDIEAVDEIVQGKRPFGTILTSRSITYECDVLALFNVSPDRMLQTEFGEKELNVALHGRSTRFTDKDGAVLADVVEILAPWVVAQPTEEATEWETGSAQYQRNEVST